mgnify:FL=1
MNAHTVVRAVADALLAGEWTPEAMADRLADAFESFTGATALIDSVVAAFPEAPFLREERLRVHVFELFWPEPSEEEGEE